MGIFGDGRHDLWRLQCGRGPKPTEITYIAVIDDGSYASMWPRAEAHGNGSVGDVRTTANNSFNVAAGRSPRKW